MSDPLFPKTATAEEVTAGLDLSGQTHVVTGCSSGLGLETVRVLALRGARVVGLARTAEKAEQALRGLGIDGVGLGCELSNLGSVREAVEALRGLGPFHGILANAGIMALPTLQQIHGVERQLFVNHVGHFVLINGLLDQLTPDGRVTVLSSGAHHFAKRGIDLDNASGERDYDEWEAYGRSKLANILFANALAKRLPAGRVANSVHPGVILTNLSRHMDPAERDSMFQELEQDGRLKTVGQGAATQVLVATHPALASTTATYFSNCKPSRTLDHAQDPEQAEALWDWTEALVQGL